MGQCAVINGGFAPAPTHEAGDPEQSPTFEVLCEHSVFAYRLPPQTGKPFRLEVFKASLPFLTSAAIMAG